MALHGVLGASLALLRFFGALCIFSVTNLGAKSTLIWKAIQLQV